MVGGSGGQPNSAAFFNECIGNLFRPCFAPDGGQSGAPVFNFDTEAPILWGFGGIPSATTTSRQQTDQRPPPPATPSQALWAPPPPYAAQRWTDQPRGASAPPTTANTNSSQGQRLLTEAYPRRPSSATIIGPNLATTTGLQGPPTACPICQAPAPHAPYLQHRAFECPVNYHRRLGEPCPGFDEAGYRLKYGMGSRKHLGHNRWKRARKGLLHKERLSTGWAPESTWPPTGGSGFARANCTRSVGTTCRES